MSSRLNRPRRRTWPVGVAPLLILLVLACGFGEPRALEAQEPPAATSRKKRPVDSNKLFTDANRLFNTGKTAGELEDAADKYAELLRSGHESADLHYNLGSTYLRLQEPGPAILHFRRALLHEPDHAYARAMLESARAEVQDVFEGEEETSLARTLFFWHFEYPAPSRALALVTAWTVFWALLCLGLFVRVPLARTLGLVLGVLTLALAASILIEKLGQRGEAAVIVAPEVVVRRGPGERSDRLLETPVHSGVEVRILETRSVSHQVEFPGGLIGWIPANTAERIRGKSG